MAGKGGGKSLTGGVGNGPLPGIPRSSGPNPGPSGHPVSGKGNVLKGDLTSD